MTWINPGGRRLAGQNSGRTGRTAEETSAVHAQHEDVLPEILHLVERPDVRHAALDRGSTASWSARTSSATATTATKGGKIDPALGFERRWVIYNGYAEPVDRIPPSWHGWMHHTVDVPPTEENYKPRPWQKPHRPNLTGTPGGVAPDRLDAGAGPPPQGDRRLQGVGSGREVGPFGSVFSPRVVLSRKPLPASPGTTRPLPAVFSVLTSTLLGRGVNLATNQHRRADLMLQRKTAGKPCLAWRDQARGPAWRS